MKGDCKWAIPVVVRFSIEYKKALIFHFKKWLSVMSPRVLESSWVCACTNHISQWSMWSHICGSLHLCKSRREGYYCEVLSIFLLFISTATTGLNKITRFPYCTHSLLNSSLNPSDPVFQPSPYHFPYSLLHTAGV